MQAGPSTESQLVSVAESDEEDSGSRNPFRLPADSNIFVLKKQERERKKLEQQKKLKMKVHERGLYVTRRKAKQAELWCELRAGREEDAANEKAMELRDNSAWKVAMIKDRNIEKESINEFVSKKREMFLLEYALAVKREEMGQLEEAATVEEKKLARAAKLLEKDSIMFDEFLKESDKSSVEAIKIAEQESKIKQEKVSEIKRITAKMVAIKSDISKYEDTLKEYSMYKDFLFKLSPPEWQQEQLARRKTMQKALPTIAEKDKSKNTGQQEKRAESRASTTKKELPALRRASRHSISFKPAAQTGSQPGKQSPKPSMEPKTEDVSLSDYEEEPAMFFTDPQQLLDLLTDLEEQNLSLIQNSRETEESLEELRLVLDQTRKRMEKETEQLVQQIDSMTHNIQQEHERASQLEIKARLFSYGKYKEDDQNSMLDSLGHKVEEVYRSCIGDSEGNLSTLQMLTAIEGRLGEVLENVDAIPHERVLMAEKAKEKERRVRLREEKINQQKKHQEERLRKALERAQADISKTKGKKLMTRSQPPERKKKEAPSTDMADQDREEHLYFFT
ncbi:cilia- and flagella-associated protein 100 [Conger conger]|uniref:cilia- and flagella-associated protein 100 n=1 Tax=Conger conger TaxID=82655 RepID=UPI002A5AAFD2|nr:cilia- and flagella-associated protein 100 [Conger conger]XP_061076613.1 cilia- and flagella-associated protein 100 [Conger conger]XP_061076614.1 cilia- and flagella-associated protein 100 [Conger conger]